MQASLFEMDSGSDYRRPGFAKSMASKARRPRAGLRADTEPGDDAALEVTGRLLQFGADERCRVRIIRMVQGTEPTERQCREGVATPSVLSRKKSEILATDLYESFNLVPERVVASVEGGILFAYKRGDGLRLEIEVDNDGDIVGVISTQNAVIRSEFIDLPAKLSHLVRDFKLSRTLAV